VTKIPSGIGDIPDGPCSRVFFGPMSEIRQCPKIGKAHITGTDRDDYRLEYWCEDHWPVEPQASELRGSLT
jgi:hypothetical protein